MDKNIIDKLVDSLRGYDGYVEVRYITSRNFSIVLRNRKVEQIAPASSAGGAVRALVPNHGWGFATFNNISQLKQAIENAISASKAIKPSEPIKLAEVEPVTATILSALKDHFSNHSIDEKYRMLLGYDEILASMGDRIVDRYLAYGEEEEKIYFVSNEGTRLYKERVDMSVRCQAKAMRGNNVQSAHDSYATRHSFSELKQQENMVRKVGDIAVKLLDAPSVESGVYTVVLDPALAGVFIHEAFGHLSEADQIEDNPQAREMMQIGKRFGPEFLNVIDDGTVTPEIRGTILYDDEGVPAQKTYLIKDGILVGRLHNRQTAQKFGEKPTGNARAQNYLVSPVIRMTNTAIEPGPFSAKNIFDGIKLGVYAIDAYGGETMLENFSFSAGHAYMIRDGKIAELVKDVVLAGNLFKTLASIEQIADDFVWSTSGGMCGKAGQSAKVAEGSPHIRISNVVIGGK